MSDQILIDGKFYKVHSQFTSEVRRSSAKILPKAKDLLEEFGEMDPHEQFFTELIFRELPDLERKGFGVISKAELAIQLTRFILKRTKPNQLKPQIWKD